MGKIFDKVISAFSNHPKGKEKGTKTKKSKSINDSEAKVSSKNKKMEDKVKDKKKVVKEEHEFVDLGLPSGNLWAKCNMGAKNEYELGDYYRYAEVEACEVRLSDDGDPRTLRREHPYKDALDRITKYNSDSEVGVVDNKTELEPIDDAATVQWGNGWRIPTIKDWEELYENCSIKRLTSHNGYMYVSKNNGNYIFLPMRCKKMKYHHEPGKIYDIVGGEGFSAYYHSSTVHFGVSLCFYRYVRDRRKKLPEVYEKNRISHSTERSFMKYAFLGLGFIRPIRKKS